MQDSDVLVDGSFVRISPSDRAAGHAIVKKLRTTGFILELDAENCRPKITPVDRLTPKQRELLKKHKAVILDALWDEKLRNAWS